ncbi:DUF1801 domain-containing protein [Robertmurraya kyonggiensis]|uniref:DUF1801 domain-containing protein n=1 Tax=Robertmurraya kyonggiensis TaxID=1037680 RepID=A0A4U1D1W1_9BACI|nr:DUF1801 domain-containing protein [Robertmurraya kyonggiensis]TKC16299.1 DUF1801 domain-containing protein [Robertmurraya kyonggiensis]
MVEKNREIDEVNKFILNLPPDIQNIAISLRKIILNTSTELIEEYKWSMPNYSYNGLVCYLQTAKNHVNLGFHRGNELQEKDVNKLLQGTGKALRYIRIKKLEEVQPEAFTSLILEAMRLNE